MPTKNPRLSITFEPSFLARLRRLSELTGNSQGAMAAELLVGCAPAIDRLIQLLEAAKSAKADVLDKLVSDMESAQGRIEQQIGLALAESDVITSGLLEEAEKIRRRRGRGGMRKRVSAAASEASSTPISNRGVRSKDNTIETIATELIQTKAKQVKRQVKSTGVGHGPL